MAGHADSVRIVLRRRVVGLMDPKAMPEIHPVRVASDRTVPETMRRVNDSRSARKRRVDQGREHFARRNDVRIEKYYEIAFRGAKAGVACALRATEITANHAASPLLLESASGVVIDCFRIEDRD